jgi:D-3-phosphoglycerate dehydrogenase
VKFKIAQLFVVEGMPDYEQMFKQAGLDAEVVKNMSPGEDEMMANAENADAIIGIGSLQPYTKKVLDSLKQCRYIASMGIGYDNIDMKAASDNCILVSNVPDYCWEEVSDHIMALILSCTRRIVQLSNAVKNGEWKHEPDVDIQRNIWPGMSRMRGQTLGMIGFGGVARCMVPKAKGFGLKIVAYDPYVVSETYTEYGVEQSEDMDYVLSESDIITTNMNLTSETRHIIGMEQLKKMKPTACVINAGRGPLIDPQALHTALVEGYISMAALDVTEPEPMPLNDPLLKLDNFIATAHSAHFSPHAWKELMSRPGQGIIRLFKDGEWPTGLLNTEIKEAYIKKWGKLK